MQLNDELRFKVLMLLDSNPHISQRHLSALLEISLGKVNFCINALEDESLVDYVRERDSEKKLSFVYRLTELGQKKKRVFAEAFLHQKVKEAESIHDEIESLRDQLKSWSG